MEAFVALPDARASGEQHKPSEPGALSGSAAFVTLSLELKLTGNTDCTTPRELRYHSPTFSRRRSAREPAFPIGCPVRQSNMRALARTRLVPLVGPGVTSTIYCPYILGGRVRRLVRLPDTLARRTPRAGLTTVLAPVSCFMSAFIVNNIRFGGTDTIRSRVGNRVV